MTDDRKISARNLIVVAGICFAIFIIVFAVMISGQNHGRVSGIP